MPCFAQMYSYWELGNTHFEIGRLIRTYTEHASFRLVLITCASMHECIIEKFIRRILENYCFVLLTNRAPPQISDNRPDLRHKALFVTSRVANVLSIKIIFLLSTTNLYCKYCCRTFTTLIKHARIFSTEGVASPHVRTLDVF